MDIDTYKQNDIEISQLISLYITSNDATEKSSIINSIILNIKDKPLILQDLLVNINKSFLEINDHQLKILVLTIFHNTIQPLESIIRDFIKQSLITKEFLQQELTIMFKSCMSNMKNTLLVTISLKIIHLLIRTDLVNLVMSSNSLVKTLLEIFNYESFPTPTYNQETRITVYYILLSIINNPDYFNIILSNFSNTFCILCLNSIEGEKDPRNLLVMFNLIYSLLNLLPVDIVNNNKEQVLNIFEDYYPIEFNPPKNSPVKITQGELSLALNQALFANHSIIKDVLEMIKDRANSVNLVYKIESVRSVLFCFKNKSSSEDHSKNKPIWKESMDFIVSEIFNNIDDTLHLECINALSSLLRYSDTEDINVLETINSLFSKCIDFLFSTEPQKSSYDARDILLLILEYNKEDRKIQKIREEKIIESFLSSASNYLNMKGEIHILKNIGSLILFLIKKERKQYFDSNKFPSLKLILLSLVKKDFLTKNKEDTMTLFEILITFVLNFDLFESEEIQCFYNKLFTYFNSLEANETEFLIKISFLRKELISKFEFLNDLSTCLNIISSSEDVGLVTKNFVLLKEYLNENNIRDVLAMIFKISFKNSSFLNESIVDLIESILIIKDKNKKGCCNKKNNSCSKSNCNTKITNEMIHTYVMLVEYINYMFNNSSLCSSQENYIFNKKIVTLLIQSHQLQINEEVSMKYNQMIDMLLSFESININIFMIKLEFKIVLNYTLINCISGINKEVNIRDWLKSKYLILSNSYQNINNDSTDSDIKNFTKLISYHSLIEALLNKTQYDINFVNPNYFKDNITFDSIYRLIALSSITSKELLSDSNQSISNLVSTLNLISSITPKDNNSLFKIIRELKIFKFSLLSPTFKISEEKLVSIFILLEEYLRKISKTDTLFEVVVVYSLQLFNNYSIDLLKSNINKVIIVLMSSIECKLQLFKCISFLKDIILFIDDSLNSNFSVNTVLTVLMDNINLMSVAETSNCLVCIYHIINKFNNTIESREVFTNRMKSMLYHKKRSIRKISGFIMRKLILNS